MANGPVYVSYNKASDWARGIGYNVQLSDSGIALPQTEKFAAHKVFDISELLGSAELADLALGRGSKVYLLDDRAAVWSVDADSGLVEALIPPNHSLFGRYANLAAAEDVLLIADPQSDHKLMALTINSGQIVWERREARSQPLLVLAMAVDHRNHIHLLTPEEPGEEQPDLPIAEGTPLVLLELDSYGDLVQHQRLQAWQIDRTVPVAQLHNRYQLAVTPQLTVYAVDSAARKGLRIKYPDGALDRPGTEEELPDPAASVGSGPDGSVFVGDSNAGEEGRFVKRLDAEDQVAELLTGYIGHADRLLLDAPNRLFILNRKEGRLTCLTKIKMTRSYEDGGSLTGYYYTTAIDSHISEVVWHKLALHAQYDGDTQLTVRYCASNSKMRLVGGAWVELDEYLLDSSIPLADKLEELKPLWSKPLFNPRDALFFQAQGRYLWLFFEFSGNELSSPEVSGMRIYYPRTSYLSYLPAVYQEDPQSKDFLERYFSLFATFLDGLDERIDQVVRYFDVDAVSGPYLKWLATWLGIASQDHWSEEQLKRLMKAAPELYKQKGTRASLEKLVAIYTGEPPIIIESFQIQHLLEKQEFAPIVPLLYGDNPYCFNVLVKQEHADNEHRRIVLQKILDEYKPAYTEARLIVLQPWVYMDFHSYLGVNTYLSEPKLFVLDDKSSLPHHTIIIDVERENRMDIHTRLELDSELE